MSIDPISIKMPLRVSAPSKPAAPQVPASIQELPASPIPKEWVKHYGPFPGLRLQGEINRLTIQSKQNQEKMRLPSWQKAWGIFLFGEDSSHPDSEDEEFSGLEFLSDHLQQGNINDCFLVAAIYTALKNPSIGKTGLAKLIEPFEVFVPTYELNGSVEFNLKTIFRVVFPSYPNHPILLDPMDMAAQEQVKGGVGFRLIELAFAQLSQKLSLSTARNNSQLNEALNSINGGGHPSIALQALTGQQVNSFWKNVQDTDSHLFALQSTELLAQIRRNPHRFLVMAATDGHEGGYRDPEKRFLNWHAFSVEQCKRSDRVIVINPWDTSKHRHAIETEELVRYFDGLIWAEVSQVE